MTSSQQTCTLITLHTFSLLFLECFDLSLVLSPLLQYLPSPLASNRTHGAVAQQQMWETLDQTSAVTERHQSAICEALVCALLGCGWEIKSLYGAAVCKDGPSIMCLCVISASKRVCRHNSGAVGWWCLRDPNVLWIKGSSCLLPAPLSPMMASLSAFSWGGGDAGDPPAVVA